MKKLRRIALSLITCITALVITCIPVFAATEDGGNVISAPNEFVITSDMVDENGDISFDLGDGYGFEGKITISKNLERASTDTFKLTGRFYKTEDGSTISDYWLSASFYVSSQKVYIDSYDSRHTKVKGASSSYKANVNNTTTSGDGTSTATVKAEFELLLNGSPSPGTSDAYLQVTYNKDKTWSIAGNYDGATTP